MLHTDRRSKNATIRVQFSKEMPTMNETMNEDRYDDTVRLTVHHVLLFTH
jgi:hypothetical protein